MSQSGNVSEVKPQIGNSWGISMGGSNGPNLKDGSFGSLCAEQKHKHTSRPDSYLVITQSPSKRLVSRLVGG